VRNELDDYAVSMHLAKTLCFMLSSAQGVGPSMSALLDFILDLYRWQNASCWRLIVHITSRHTVAQAKGGVVDDTALHH
jgi:hypothetical protein